MPFVPPHICSSFPSQGMLQAASPSSLAVSMLHTHSLPCWSPKSAIHCKPKEEPLATEWSEGVSDDPPMPASTTWGNSSERSTEQPFYILDLRTHSSSRLARMSASAGAPWPAGLNDTECLQSPLQISVVQL